MTTVVTPEPPPCVYDLFSTPASIDEAVAANSKDELYALCDDPMVRPVKLINENLHLDNSQDVRNCFIENSGFLVVGVIGLQGTGKSSVANLMANRLVEGPPCDGPFPVQTVASLIEGYPRTTAGVDMYITQDRVIILDTQPLRSWALTDLYIQQDLRSRHQQQQQQLEDVGGGPTGSGKWSVDGYAEMSSLQDGQWRKWMRWPSRRRFEVSSTNCNVSPTTRQV
uniref:Protein SMG9 n=1 Tax=Mesocestoides corti TaxID=53468 RepID=A0A5K3FTJ6_MESCO